MALFSAVAQFSQSTFVGATPTVALGVMETSEVAAHRRSMGMGGILALLVVVRQQPLLWNEHEQLGLLPLQECRAADAESWLTHLQTEPHLLPADLSLLEGRPWCEAGLLAVPPPGPLAERLWLLVRAGDAEQPQLTDLIETLRLQILMRFPDQP
jgi:hypothetical protein